MRLDERPFRAAALGSHALLRVTATASLDFSGCLASSASMSAPWYARSSCSRASNVDWRASRSASASGRPSPALQSAGHRVLEFELRRVRVGVEFRRALILERRHLGRRVGLEQDVRSLRSAGRARRAATDSRRRRGAVS